MAFAKVNDINMYYELIGQGEPIVFLSGFSTNRETWRNYSERLSSQYQTLILDNRGAGESDAPPPPYTVEMMAEDTAALMDHVGIKEATMVGSSMGTAIIQTLALRHPSKVKKGILISPFAKLPLTSLMKSETVGKLLEVGVPLNLVIESVIPWLYSNAFLDDGDRAKNKSQEMLENPYPQKPEGYLGQLTALKAFDLRDQVGDIQAEMLLIAGAEDLSTPLYCSHFLSENLPACTLKVFESVGHMAHVEQRDKVFEVIQNFLNN